MTMDITKTSDSEPPIIVEARLSAELPATTVPPSDKDTPVAPLDLALFISALDQTIIAQSIPTISKDLHSASGYVWVSSAYLLANAATGPIWAKCSDIWGRKPILLTAIALFTAASIIAALSTNMPMLIAGRALQGAASGGLMQLVIIIISDLFSIRERSLYLGFCGFVWALAGSSGPLIGGTLTDVQQASPIRSGILLLPLIVPQALGEIAVGFIIRHTGHYREFIWAGVLLMTLGTGLYISFGLDTSVPTIVGLEIIGALGPSLLFQAPMVAIQNTVTQKETSTATASLIFLRSVGMSLSVILGGVVFQNSMDTWQSSFAAAGLSGSVLEALSGSQVVANINITHLIKDTSQRHVVLEAFAWSVRNIFIMYTCFAATAVVASLFIEHRKLNTEHTETKTGIQQLTKAENAKE
ncbi:hypothetical protein B7463_g4167, partial [Scytalidium lignicola]